MIAPDDATKKLNAAAMAIVEDVFDAILSNAKLRPIMEDMEIWEREQLGQHLLPVVRSKLIVTGFPMYRDLLPLNPVLSVTGPGNAGTVL